MKRFPRRTTYLKLVEKLDKLEPRKRLAMVDYWIGELLLIRSSLLAQEALRRKRD